MSNTSTRIARDHTFDGKQEVRGVRVGATLDAAAYERWVAGYDVTTDVPKGRLRTDDRAVRFVEVVVNGPKTCRSPRRYTPRSRRRTTRHRTSTKSGG